jgi:hypothetical protein
MRVRQRLRLVHQTGPCKPVDSESRRVSRTIKTVMDRHRHLDRAFAFLLILFAAASISPSVAEEGRDSWRRYLEYLDPTRKAVMFCYYDYRRILSSGDSPGMLLVWEKVAPRDDYLDARGEERGKRFVDTTSLYEIDCEAGEIRILETYGHYEDVTRYNLEPSPWQDVMPGSRLERLVGKVCPGPL